MRRLLALMLIALALAVTARAGSAPLLVRNPTLSASAVAFELAGDRWSVPLGGGDARRLTASTVAEVGPRFSPDGAWIAFTVNDGENPDVHVMPANGGTPRRLTWGAARNEVVGWTNDSRRVLFRSWRLSSTDHPRLFTIGLEG